MKFRVASTSFALAAADTHAANDGLKPLSAEGPFLVFDFSHCESLEEARESIRSMDVCLAGLIADEDEPAEIAALSQLKSAVIAIETDVVRENTYKNRAQITASEAVAADAESQLHTNTHAAINDSSNSNGAEATDEELKEYEQAQQGQERRSKRKR